MLGKMHVMCYATCLYNNLLFSVVAAIVPSCLCALKAYMLDIPTEIFLLA